jgi:hypothetical protein
LGGANAEPKTVSLAPGFQKAERKVTEFVAEKKVEKELTEKELREEYEKMKNRVAYLEAEIVKKDARIKELSGN